MIFANILQALVYILHFLIQIYIMLIVVRAFISWMGDIPHHPLINLLYRLTNPVLRFVRWRFPFLIIGGIDITPMIIIMALYFIDHLLTGWLLRLIRTL